MWVRVYTIRRERERESDDRVCTRAKVLGEEEEEECLAEKREYKKINKNVCVLIYVCVCRKNGKESVVRVRRVEKKNVYVYTYNDDGQREVK